LLLGRVVEVWQGDRVSSSSNCLFQGLVTGEGGCFPAHLTNLDSAVAASGKTNPISTEITAQDTVYKVLTAFQAAEFANMFHCASCNTPLFRFALEMRS
jgi:hypothetical protein